MIEELRSWADWCVSCACGGKSAEVEAAYWAIDEIARLRSALEDIASLKDQECYAACVAKEALK